MSLPQFIGFNPTSYCQYIKIMIFKMDLVDFVNFDLVCPRWPQYDPITI